MVNVKRIDAEWLIADDGERQTRFAAVRDGDAMWIFVEGQVEQVNIANRPAGRSRTRSAGTVMSPMPATVVSINIAAGDTIVEGQTLIVLEAMKMELPIKAPRAGVVKAIHCVKGDLVQPGINLLDIE